MTVVIALWRYTNFVLLLLLLLTFESVKATKKRNTTLPQTVTTHNWHLEKETEYVFILQILSWSATAVSPSRLVIINIINFIITLNCQNTNFSDIQIFLSSNLQTIMATIISFNPFTSKV